MKFRLVTMLLMICFFANLYSDNKPSKSEILKAVRHYQRLMESAHPSPDIELIKKYQSNSPYLPQSKSPIFLNVSTIGDESQEQMQMQNESSIAVNPTNPQNIIASAVDYRANSSTWVYVSHDGGKSFVNINLGKPFPNWRSSNDPSVYFSADGIAYLNYGGFGEMIDSFDVSVGENGVFVSKSTDQGKTWKAHIPVILHKGVQTLDSTFEDKYYVQVDNSPNSPYFKHAYIPWKRVTPRDSATQIVLSKSIDEGETWSEPLPISPRLAGSSEDTTFGQSFPLCTTGPDGEVYLVWNNGIAHSVGFARSLDGGATFTSPRLIQTYNRFGTTRFLQGQGYRHTVKEKVRAEAYPVVQCDISSARKGTLYLCWAADNIPNIYFSKSTDKGDTWSEPIVIHSDPTNDQFWPWMAIDPKNGDIAIMYFDSRNDPENMMVECFVSYSSDGGNTWIDRQASDISTDLRLNPFFGNAFAGDYSGCAFYDGIIYPSWVDMRYAVSALTDSDVFTAIINTRAPEPVENLESIIIPEDASKLVLNWVNPKETSFGKALSADEFDICVFRNNQFLTKLDGSVDNFEDSQLTAHTEYSYKLIAVSKSGKDSSIVRSTSAFAGGSKEPAVPIALSSVGSSDNTALINVKLPNVRFDGTTVLSNLAKIAIYRDGQLIRTDNLAIADTGKTIHITDKTPREGYYMYEFVVIDASGYESPKSARHLNFSGEVKDLETFVENFDNDIYKFYNSGNWTSSNEISSSGDYSFTIAANRVYDNSQADTLLVFPFTSNNEQVFVSFKNAAIIANNDYATVEYSTNHGATWSNQFGTTTAKWKKGDFTAWSDNLLNEQDFRLEEMVLPASSDTILVRFRFYANVLVNDLGWYIDDLRISKSSVGVDEDGISEIAVYPNPNSGVLNVSMFDDNSKNISYEVYTLLGNKVLEGTIVPNNTFYTINLFNLETGVYNIKFINEKGIFSTKNIVLMR